MTFIPRARMAWIMVALTCGAVMGACKDSGDASDYDTDEGCPNDPYCEHECYPEAGSHYTCEAANCGLDMMCKQEEYTGCWSCEPGEMGDGDGDGDGDADGDGEPDACASATEALAPMLTSELGGCDIVVRFNYLTYEPIALSSRCGDYKGAFISEETARMMTQCCGGGELLSPLGDDGFFLFYAAPGDFGGVAAISNHLVTRMFEGTIVWGGMGDITDPVEWTEPLAWGSDCAAPLPDAQTYDLTIDPGPDVPIDPAALEPLLTALSDTAVLPAIASANNTVYRMVVLAYPRSVGLFDPNSAEYVVLLESGA